MTDSLQNVNVQWSGGCLYYNLVLKGVSMAISITSALLLICALLVIWFWFDSIKVRDKAVSAAKNTCERLGLQLLDETVQLRNLRFVTMFRGKGITRDYRFQYDRGRNKPESSHIVLEGKTVLSIGLYDSPNKVVQFPQNRRASNDHS